MRIARDLRRYGLFLAGIASLSLLLLISTAHADRMSSTNFILNGNANGSLGGSTGSTNYGMFSTSGEPAIGRGTSGSFILGDGFTAQSEQSIALTVQPGGLLGFWNFDEPSGTQFADSSATQAHANKGGVNDGDITVVPGGALNGSGAHNDSNILIPGTSIQPSSVTMSVWVLPSAMNDWDSICSYYANPSFDWGPFELYTAPTNKFHWVIRTSLDNQITTASSFPAGSWYYVVGTYDAATGVSKLYVNGVLSQTGNFTPAAISYTTANTANNISCFNNPRWPGEGLQGDLDHLKIFNRALTADEVKAEYEAQDAYLPTGISLGAVTPGSSNTALQDVIVRTDSGQYGVTLSQNHDLQNGAATIPAISASIASPAAWSEGVTKGLGFTLINAPALDGKWGSGTNYAAIPTTATSFYTRTSHASSDTIDVINGRLRVDTTAVQGTGAYSNTVTYTGTTIP